MGRISSELLRDTARKLIGKAAVYLPNDVKQALCRAYELEESITAKNQLKAILDNIELAADRGLAICQDTGVPIFFLSLGLGVTIEGDPVKALEQAVWEATQEIPLRRNVINPLTKRNPGTNTGWGVPILHWDVVPGGDCLEMTFVPKGFGAEMRAVQSWVLTSEDISRAAVKAVLDVVEDSMGEPCPPVIIGVGIGGTADHSMHIAKKARGGLDQDSFRCKLNRVGLTA